MSWILAGNKLTFFAKSKIHKITKVHHKEKFNDWDHDFFKSQIGNHPQEDLAKFCYIPIIN
jgi:hypothetical protein